MAARKLPLLALTAVMCAFAPPILLSITSARPALAQTAPTASPSAEARQQEQQVAFSAGFAAATVGAAEVALIDQGRLNLPAGFVFIPKAEGAGMMRAIGNSTGPDFLGLIMPENDATTASHRFGRDHALERSCREGRREH